MTEADRPYTIRAATSMDVVNITRLLKSAWEEGPTHVLRVNETKALQWIMDSIREAFVLVADLNEGRRLLGTIAFTPMRMPWSDDLLMGKLWFCARLFKSRERVLGDLLVAAEKFMDMRRVVMQLDVAGPPNMPCEFSLGIAGRRGYTAVSSGAFLRAPAMVQRDEASKLQEAFA